MVQQEYDEITVSAYEKARSIACSLAQSSSSVYPIELLIEWDNVRLKLNPKAKLSAAQKQIIKSRSSQDQVKMM